MGKFLKHFSSLSEYNEYKESLEYMRPNVSYVDEGSETRFHGGLLFGYYGFISSDGYGIATDGDFHVRKISF